MAQNAAVVFLLPDSDLPPGRFQMGTVQAVVTGGNARIEAAPCQ